MVVRKAQRERVNAEMKDALRYNTRKDVTPTQALLEEVKWTAGAVDYLRARIDELDPHAMWQGPVKVKSKHHTRDDGVGGHVHGQGHVAELTQDHGLRVHTLWTMLMREREHLVTVSATAIRVGLEERQVKLAEDQGRIVAAVIKAVLGDLMLTPDQVALVGEVVPRRLREAAIDGV